MKRSTALLRALAVAAMLVAPLAVAAPAHASVTKDGCTVDAKNPYHNGTFTGTGVKWIDYDVDFDCTVGVIIEAEMERWEADSGLNGADDFIGWSTKTRTMTSSHYDWKVTGTLPDSDGGADQWSEMYQRVRFRVTSGPVTGSWSNWDYTATISIHV